MSMLSARRFHLLASSAFKTGKTRAVFVTRDSHLLFEDGKTVPDLKGRYDLKTQHYFVRRPGELEHDCGQAYGKGSGLSSTKSPDGKEEYHVMYDPRTAAEFIAAVSGKTLAKPPVTGKKRKAKRIYDDDATSGTLYILNKIVAEEDNDETTKSTTIGVFDTYEKANEVANKMVPSLSKEARSRRETIELNIDSTHQLNRANLCGGKFKCTKCKKPACQASLHLALPSTCVLCTDHYEDAVARQNKADFDANDAGDQNSSSDDEDATETEQSDEDTDGTDESDNESDKDADDDDDAAGEHGKGVSGAKATPPAKKKQKR